MVQSKDNKNYQINSSMKDTDMIDCLQKFISFEIYNIYKMFRHQYPQVSEWGSAFFWIIKIINPQKGQFLTFSGADPRTKYDVNIVQNGLNQYLRHIWSQDQHLRMSKINTPIGKSLGKNNYLFLVRFSRYSPELRTTHKQLLSSFVMFLDSPERIVTFCLSTC